jgi:hypothetical protein
MATPLIFIGCAILAKIFSMISYAAVNPLGLDINGSIDRGKDAKLFKQGTKHTIKWNNIVAVVKPNRFANQYACYIYYVDEAEIRTQKIDVEKISRISAILDLVQNKDDLKNEITSRAQNAAAVFDEIKPENLSNWGLTNEDCDKFYSLKNTFHQKLMVIRIIIAVVIGLTLILLLLKHPYVFK